jgi:hypothetical protein
MSRYTTVLFLICLFLTVPAKTSIVQSLEVPEIDNIAVNSSFDAATGTLTWSNGGIATLYYDTGNSKYRVTVDATMSGITDTSQNDTASASFSSCTFTINFYSLSDTQKQTSIGYLSGDLYPGYQYSESAIQENPTQLYGSAIVQLADFSFSGYAWSKAMGAKDGLAATTSNLFGNWGNIDNYQSDWASNNTIVKLVANATGIPEPASILLLSLGGLALIRKRRA